MAPSLFSKQKTAKHSLTKPVALWIEGAHRTQASGVMGDTYMRGKHGSSRAEEDALGEENDDVSDESVVVLSLSGPGKVRKSPLCSVQ